MELGALVAVDAVPSGPLSVIVMAAPHLDVHLHIRKTLQALACVVRLNESRQSLNGVLTCGACVVSASPIVVGHTLRVCKNHGDRQSFASSEMFSPYASDDVCKFLVCVPSPFRASDAEIGGS